MVTESLHIGFVFIFASIGFSIGIESVTARNFKSPVSWHHFEYDARNLALGHSSVALAVAIQQRTSGMMKTRMPFLKPQSASQLTARDGIHY